MNIQALAGLSALALSSAAMAADLPRYDVERYCENVSGDSHDSFNFCIDDEQESYDKLRTFASSVSDQTMSYCIDASSDSYDSLLFCIQDEQEAASNRRSFSFD